MGCLWWWRAIWPNKRWKGECVCESLGSDIYEVVFKTKARFVVKRDRSWLTRCMIVLLTPSNILCLAINVELKPQAACTKQTTPLRAVVYFLQSGRRRAIQFVVRLLWCLVESLKCNTSSINCIIVWKTSTKCKYVVVFVTHKPAGFRVSSPLYRVFMLRLYEAERTQKRYILSFSCAPNPVVFIFLLVV